MKTLAIIALMSFAFSWLICYESLRITERITQTHISRIEMALNQ